MAEFHLLRPYWLLAIFPVLLLLLVHRKKAGEEERFKSVVDSHLLEFLVVGQSRKERLRPQVVLFVLLFFSVFALCGPTFRQEPSPFAGDDAVLMVLMKLGQSMDSQDVQPSRLARAKQKLQDLLELRKGKSTGLVVYSGSSHLVMVPTTDSQVISTMIEDLTPDLMPVQGDDLVGAMVLGIQFIQQAGAPGSILVMADTVSQAQLSELEKLQMDIAVQLHSFNPPGSNVDEGLRLVGEIFSTSPVRLTIDTSDVEILVKRAAVAIRHLADSDDGLKWRDEGYWFVPLIALCFLLWFRKGWVVT